MGSGRFPPAEDPGELSGATMLDVARQQVVLSRPNKPNDKGDPPTSDKGPSRGDQLDHISAKSSLRT